MSRNNLYGSLAGLVIVSAFVFGLIVTNHVDKDSTPLITTVLGFFGLFLMSLRNSEAVDRVDKKTDKMLNGVMDEKIQRNVHAVLSQRETGSTDYTPLD